jgi:hypothetical protein
VGRVARLPADLTAGPFTLADALRAGLDRWHLEGSSWRRVGPSVYAWAGIPDSPDLRLAAARQRLPQTAVFSGLAAAWLHGLDVVGCEPIEVTIPKGAGVSARSGLVVRRAAVAAAEVVNLRGMRATSILRTLSDLCIRLSALEAVVIVDMALHAGLSLANLNSLCLSRVDCVGVANLRRVVGLADPAAESPMETRLRMVLVLGGLPRPQAQVSLHDSRGRFLGRPDLYYPDHPPWTRIRRRHPSHQPCRGQPPPEPTACCGNSATALHRERCPPQSGLHHDAGAHRSFESTDITCRCRAPAGNKKE